MNSLADEVKILEREIFPDVEFLGDDIRIDKRNVDGQPWIYFAPHFYAEQPAVLTRKLITRLRNGCNMLSVGCGPAYLEQYLVKAYDISPKNIILSDMDDIGVPEGFGFVRFDMHTTWPRFDSMFDYIIFPESIFFGSSKDEHCQSTYEWKFGRFKHLLEESVSKLNFGGEMIMKGMIPSKNVVNSAIEGLSMHDAIIEYQYETGSLLKRYLSIKK